MRPEGSCSKCGSTKVVPRARVIDRGDYNIESGNIRVGVARKPAAWILKGEEKADLYARVCGDCGFAELFVQNSQAVYAAYVASLSETDRTGG